MRQSHENLRDTLARIRAILAGFDSEPAQVLDPCELGRAAGLTAAEVHALLDGQELPDDEIEQRVCRRVRALYLYRIAATGKRPSDIRLEIQNHLQRSHEWARLLCNGSKVPNVADLHGLREYFELPDRFHFTDSPAQALNTALQPILRTLEARSGSLLERYLGELDQLVIEHRGAPLTQSEVTVMTTFVTSLLEGVRTAA